MFKLKIRTENAAFHEHEGAMGEELATILERIAGQLREGYTSSPQVQDSNGNRCGSWELSQ